MSEPEQQDWACPYCGGKEEWFDRSVSVYSDGTEDGPHYRCASCGEITDNEDAKNSTQGTGHPMTTTISEHARRAAFQLREKAMCCCWKDAALADAIIQTACDAFAQELVRELHKKISPVAQLVRPTISQIEKMVADGRSVEVMPNGDVICGGDPLTALRDAYLASQQALAAEREKVRLLREVVQDMKDLWDGDGDSGFPLYDAAKAALAGPQSERTEKTS